MGLAATIHTGQDQPPGGVVGIGVTSFIDALQVELLFSSQVGTAHLKAVKGLVAVQRQISSDRSSRVAHLSESQRQ